MLEIEELSLHETATPCLALSTRIQETVERGIKLQADASRSFSATRLPIWWFYGSVALELAGGFMGSLICMLRQ